VLGGTRRLLARLGGLWRRAWTPKAVREVEDAGPERAVDALLPPAPRPADTAREAREVREMRERLERIEHRNRELARLYDRRREGA
jgi:hypothetical protein